MRQATDRMRSAADAQADPKLRGVLKQHAAAYLHPTEPVAAQTLHSSAQMDNPGAPLLRAGVEHTRIKATADQAHTTRSPSWPSDARPALS